MSDEEIGPAEGPQESEVTIIMPPDQLGGVWANFAQVSHSEHEFTIDFVRIHHASRQGVVVARVGVSPLFVTQLVEALETNWQKFAEKALPPGVLDDDNDTS